METASPAFNILLASTSIRFVLVRRVGLVREILTTFFFSEGVTETSPAALISSFFARSTVAREDTEFLETLPASFWKSFSRGAFDGELSHLEKMIDNQPLFPITFARALPLAHAEAVGAWVRRTLGPSLLLDVSIDPSVSAGCRFIWRDRLYDFSLPRLLEEKKNELVAALVPARAEARAGNTSS